MTARDSARAMQVAIRAMGAQRGAWPFGQGDHSLGEGDVEAGAFQGVLQLRLHAPVGLPVVLVLRPETEGQVDGTVGQFGNQDFGGGVLEDEGMFLHEFQEHLHSLGEGVPVGDAHGDVGAAPGVAGVVFDGGAEEYAVGGGDEEPVQGGEGGGEQPDFPDCAADAAAVDVVAQFIGP